MKMLKYFIVLSIGVSFFASADVIGVRTAAQALVLQANARPVVSGYAESCNKNQVMIARYLTDGSLDGTLNGTGYNTTIFGGSASGNALTIQPSDQKIVVAGYSDDTIGVLRYTSGGVLDTTFGTNGRINLNLGLNEQAYGVAMQSGKILIAGGATVAGATQFFVSRLNATGALDVGFGTSGITTTLIGDGAQAQAIGLQSNGKIILAGIAVVNGQLVTALARYTSSGVLDATFGTGGTTYTSVGNFAFGNALAIDSSNRLIVAGYAIVNGGVQQIVILRYTSSGTLDGSFGTSGVVLIDIPDTPIDRGTGVAVQADGNIVVAGKSGSQVIVARLNGTDGSLDTTFGSGGYVLTSIGSDAGASAIAVQPADQMLVVAGFSDLSVMLARYDVDGTLDASFGDSGTGWILEPQGSVEAICGNCTSCPTGPQGPVGATGTASLASYAYFYNSSLSLDLSLLSLTPVPYDAEGIKNNITHSTVSNPDQITIVTSGIYKATAVVDLSVALLGTNFALFQNGTAIPGTTFSLAGVGSTVVQATFAANAGDIIQVAQVGLLALSVSGVSSVTIEQIA